MVHGSNFKGLTGKNRVLIIICANIGTNECLVQMVPKIKAGDEGDDGESGRI